LRSDYFDTPRPTDRVAEGAGRLLVQRSEPAHPIVHG
jgi:hypothetical protein